MRDVVLFLDRIAVVRREADNIKPATAGADAAVKKIVIVYDKFPMGLIKFYARKVYRLWVRISNKVGSSGNRGGNARPPEASRGRDALAEQ